MYESYYFNFIGSLSRPRLEELATVGVQTNTFNQIQKVSEKLFYFPKLLIF